MGCCRNTCKNQVVLCVRDGACVVDDDDDEEEEDNDDDDDTTVCNG